MDVISMFAIVCYSQESVHSSQNRIKNLCQSKRWTQNFSVSIHSTAQLSNNTPMDQCRGKAHHTAVLVQYSWPWFIDWQMTYHSVFKWQETTSMCQAPSHSALHWQPLATRLFVFHSSSRTAHQWLVSKLVTQLTSSVFFRYFFFGVRSEIRVFRRSMTWAGTCPETTRSSPETL